MPGRIFYILVFSFALKHACAQDAYIGMQQGLSNRFVTCILQDHNGLIWVGTSNGLNVYDGYSFKNYSTHSRDLKLSNAHINCIAEDPSGVLWVGTDKGLNRISPARNTNNVIPEMNNRNICSITIDHDRVLLGTSVGTIMQVDTAATEVKLLYSENRDVAINGITRDEHDRTWFFTNSERKMFRLTSTWQRDSSFSFDDTTPSNFILRGDVFIAGSHRKNGLSIFNSTHGGSIASSFLDSINQRYDMPIFILPSGNHALWAAYAHGVLIRIDLLKKSIGEFSRHFRRGYFGSVIKTGMEDQNGLLWVGTDGGLVKVGSFSNAFKTYYQNSDQRMPDNFISTRGMTEDPDGNIYIGSHKGLLEITRKGATSTPVADYSYNVNLRAGENGEPIIPFNMRWEDDKILLTSMLHGLFHYYPDTKKFERAAIPSNGRTERELAALFVDSEGLTWVGTRKGVRLLDRKEKRLVVPEVLEKNNAQETSWALAIVEHPRNTLWAGTNKGLFRIDKETGSIRHYHLNSVPYLSNDEILCIEPDGDQTLWLSTRGGGLMKYNIKNDVITYYNVAEGLTSDIVYAVIRHGKYLWLSTENGICRFDPATSLTKGYYEKEGISNNEFNTAAYFKASDGRIYFGGIDGVTAFYPQDLEDKHFRGRILLTSLKRGDEEMLAAISPADHHAIELDYDNRNLTIQASLLDYYNSADNRFFYRIKEQDDHWISLGNQNILRISQLPAGKHEIEMHGKNMNEQQSVNTLTIHVRVAQVFYKQAWFIAAIVVATFLIIYLFFRQREKQLVRMQQLRTKIASDLHDDVGSMLTRVSILTEVLKHKNQNRSEIDQIAQASRQATSTMSDILWSVDARNDKVENLVDRMREHAETLLQPLSITISFEAKTAAQQIIDMATRQGALLIFKEAINNIARHSNATTVSIHVTVDRNEFSMSIADNGTAITAKNSTGQGIKNMKMRAGEIKADLAIQNGNGYHISLTKKLL